MCSLTALTVLSAGLCCSQCGALAGGHCQCSGCLTPSAALKQTEAALQDLQLARFLGRGEDLGGSPYGVPVEWAQEVAEVISGFLFIGNVSSVQSACLEALGVTHVILLNYRNAPGFKTVLDFQNLIDPVGKDNVLEEGKERLKQEQTRKARLAKNATHKQQHTHRGQVCNCIHLPPIRVVEANGTLVDASTLIACKPAAGDLDGSGTGVNHFDSVGGTHSSSALTQGHYGSGSFGADVQLEAQLTLKAAHNETFKFKEGMFCQLWKERGGTASAESLSKRRRRRRRRQDKRGSVGDAEGDSASSDDEERSRSRRGKEEAEGLEGGKGAAELGDVPETEHEASEQESDNSEDEAKQGRQGEPEDDGDEQTDATSKAQVDWKRVANEHFGRVHHCLARLRAQKDAHIKVLLAGPSKPDQLVTALLVAHIAKAESVTAQAALGFLNTQVEVQVRGQRAVPPPSSPPQHHHEQEQGQQHQQRDPPDNLNLEFEGEGRVSDPLLVLPPGCEQYINEFALHRGGGSSAVCRGKGDTGKVDGSICRGDAQSAIGVLYCQDCFEDRHVTKLPLECSTPTTSLTSSRTSAVRSSSAYRDLYPLAHSLPCKPPIHHLGVGGGVNGDNSSKGGDVSRPESELQDAPEDTPEDPTVQEDLRIFDGSLEGAVERLCSGDASLTSLDLSGEHVEVEQLLTLTRAISLQRQEGGEGSPWCYLQCLKLAASGCGDRGCMILADLLAGGTTAAQAVGSGVTTGAGSANGRSDGCGSAPQSSTSQSPGLISLWLTDDVGITDDGVQSLTAALSMNRTLTALNLHGNSLRRRSGELLAACLRANDALVWLDISTNELGDQGVRSLMDCFRNDDDDDEVAANGADRSSGADGGGGGGGSSGGGGGGDASILHGQRTAWASDNASPATLAMSARTVSPLLLSDGDAALSPTTSMLGDEKTTAAAAGTGADAGGGGGVCELDASVPSSHTASENAPAKQAVEETKDTADEQQPAHPNVEETKAGTCNATLTYLDLTATGLGQLASRMMAEVLGRNTGLTALRMDHSPKFGSSEFKRLTAVLKAHNRSLTELTVEGCGLGDDAAAAVGRLLAGQNCALRCLRFGHNGVLSLGAKRIASSLGAKTDAPELYRSLSSVPPSTAQRPMSRPGSSKAWVPSLTSLDLSDNPLGPNGGQHLAAALSASSCSLRLLKMRHSLLQAEGLTAIFASIRDNSVLTDLDVSQNEVVGSSVDALCECLRHNCSLRRLALDSCSIGIMAVDRLADALAANSGLAFLSLRCNDLRERGGLALVRVFQKAGSSEIIRRRAEDIDAAAPAYRQPDHLSLRYLDLAFTGMTLECVEAWQAALVTPSAAPSAAQCYELQIVLEGNPEVEEQGGGAAPNLWRSKKILTFSSQHRWDTPVWTRGGIASAWADPKSDLITVLKGSERLKDRHIELGLVGMPALC